MGYSHGAEGIQHAVKSKKKIAERFIAECKAYTQLSEFSIAAV
jgi:hypothetical protein